MAASTSDAVMDPTAVQQMDTGTAAAASPAGGAHYEEVAASYEAAFFYSSPEYREFVMTRLLRHLGLPDEEAQIVDLGGGTGNFTQALAVAAGVRRRVLCVDAFAEMLQKALVHDWVEPMLLDAVAFAQLPPETMQYSHVLLKELVHHIPAADVAALYSGLYRQLAPGGTAVTITRPQDVDYPLFQRAKQIWKEHQPHHSVFTAAMEHAGFEVEVHSHEYHAELAKSTWLGMMRSKFWSTFSHCTQEELDEGIAEVEQQYAGQETVQFTDRLLFLVGTKAAGGSGGNSSSSGGGGAAAANGVAAGSSQVTAADGSAAGRSAGIAAAAASGGRSSTAAQQEPVLTPEQCRQYAQEGFAGPVTVCSCEEAARLYQRYLQYQQQLSGGSVTGEWRFKSHLLLPWVWDLVHHPLLLAAVSEALGGCRNLLCWSTDWFCKQPGDGAFTGWHQDSTYVALDPPNVVTAWLALTPSTTANGCLHFLPGSHRQQLPHVATHAEGNLLLKGQTIQELEQRGVVGQHIDLLPGQMTLHHIGLAHRSGPAQPGSQARVGLAIRYMAAHVQQGLEPRDSVTVVAGRDTFCHYRHEIGPPAAEMDEAALEQHRRAVAAVYPAGFERGE